MPTGPFSYMPWQDPRLFEPQVQQGQFPGLTPMPRQGVGANAATGPSNAAPNSTPQQRGLLDRIGGGFLDVFAGPTDPNLSAEENRRIRQQALIQGGLQGIIAAGRGEDTLSSLAVNALGGQQASAQAMQQAKAERDRAAYEQAMRGALSAEDPLVGLQTAYNEAIATGNVDLANAIGPVIQARMASRRTTPRGTFRERIDNPENPGDPNDKVVGIFDEETGQLIRILGTDTQRPASPLVSIDQRAENRATELNQQDADRILTAASEGAANADQLLRDIANFEALLENAETGRGQAALLEAKGFASDLLGIPEEEIGVQEAIRAYEARFAMGQLENFPGQISEREYDVALSTVAALGNTPAANRLLVQVQRRAAQRKKDYEMFLTEYQADHGLNFRTREFLEAKREWEREQAEKNPILTQQDIDRALNPNSGGGGEIINGGRAPANLPSGG